MTSDFPHHRFDGKKEVPSKTTDSSAGSPSIPEGEWKAYHDWECGPGWDYYIGPAENGSLDKAIAKELSQENAENIVALQASLLTLQQERDRLREALDAAHYYIDASDRELDDAGINRGAALNRLLWEAEGVAADLLAHHRPQAEVVRQLIDAVELLRAEAVKARRQRQDALLHNASLVAALNEGSTSANREAIEKAAEVAEQYGSGGLDYDLEPEACVSASVTSKAIASAIRQLLETQE